MQKSHKSQIDSHIITSSLLHLQYPLDAFTTEGSDFCHYCLGTSQLPQIISHLPDSIKYLHYKCKKYKTFFSIYPYEMF